MKKKGFSLMPQTIRIKSDYSGTLELNTWLGHTTLDSANANYSYGSLQKILKHGITRTGLTGVNKILILGMGGGCVIRTLRQDFHYKGSITAVEIDPEVIRIAAEVFQVRPDNQLSIYCEDAARFVETRKESYELIIVDLFIDNRVPAEFTASPFWQNVSRLVSEQGAILFNSSMHPDEPDRFSSVKAILESRFEIQELHKIQNTNTLLIGRLKSGQQPML